MVSEITSGKRPVPAITPSKSRPPRCNRLRFRV
jgi:hypothetical protein